MKIHRFIIAGIDLSAVPGQIEIADHRVFHQAKNVLKFKAGERISICDGNNNEAQGSIAGYGKKCLIVNLEKKISVDRINKNKTVLYCALLKKENFEIVVQKASEIGVGKIVPLITGRTIKTNINISRLNLIALEASELSGRIDVPEISPAVNFAQAISEAKNNDVNVMFVPGGMNVNDVLKNHGLTVGLFIGPEGGWTDEEIEFAGNNKFYSCNLGENILRGETAAIIASYLASNS